MARPILRLTKVDKEALRAMPEGWFDPIGFLCGRHRCARLETLGLVVSRVVHRGGLIVREFRKRANADQLACAIGLGGRKL